MYRAFNKACKLFPLNDFPFTVSVKMISLIMQYDQYQDFFSGSYYLYPVIIQLRDQLKI
jgi:hypothetical protein